MRERAFQLSDTKTEYIRKDRGESQRLAENLGLSPATFSHYLLGRRHIPETKLMELCRATSRKPSDFLMDAREKIIADAAIIHLTR